MKKTIYILLFSILIASCDVDEFLDVKPTGSLIPETVEHFDDLMNNPELAEGVWSNLAYMDPDVFMEEITYGYLTEEEYWKRQYEWQEDTYNVEENDADWVKRYKYIYMYNLVLNGIDDAVIETKTETDRTRIKGEAYAQRALDYFLLVNEYAPQYSAVNMNEPAIPLVTELNLSALLPRSTVGEVYDQIESDLDKAEKLLIDVEAQIRNNINFRPSISGLYALRALIALHKADFTTAVTYSNQALGAYDLLFDYTTMQHKFGSAYPWYGLVNSDYRYSIKNEEAFWSRSGRIKFHEQQQLYSQELTLLFDHTEDARFALFSSQQLKSGTDITPYFVYSISDFIQEMGMSVPNILLVNAEAKARTGDGVGAIASLNILLEKRIHNFTPLVHTDDAITLQMVKTERRKELYGTGNYLIDLKRYHAYGESVPTFTRTVPGGLTYTLEPGSNKYVVPISKRIKSINPNL